MPPGPASAEDVSPREQPPPGEERPERRGATTTAPPTPREEPPLGEERPEDGNKGQPAQISSLLPNPRPKESMRPP